MNLSWYCPFWYSCIILPVIFFSKLLSFYYLNAYEYYTYRKNYDSFHVVFLQLSSYKIINVSYCVN